MTEHDEGPEGYTGEVTVRVAGRPPETARAALVARFDPLAGSVVWSGRVAVDSGADITAGTELEVTTPQGSGRARATERDVWGNTRVTGAGRPPFAVELLDGTAVPGSEARWDQPG